MNSQQTGTGSCCYGFLCISACTNKCVFVWKYRFLCCVLNGQKLQLGECFQGVGLDMKYCWVFEQRSLKTETFNFHFSLLRSFKLFSARYFSYSSKAGSFISNRENFIFMCNRSCFLQLFLCQGLLGSWGSVVFAKKYL